MFKSITGKFFIPTFILTLLCAALIIYNRSAALFDTRSWEGYLVLAVFIILCVTTIAMIISRIRDNLKARPSPSKEE